MKKLSIVLIILSLAINMVAQNIDPEIDLYKNLLKKESPSKILKMFTPLIEMMDQDVSQEFLDSAKYYSSSLTSELGFRRALWDLLNPEIKIVYLNVDSVFYRVSVGTALLLGEDAAGMEVSYFSSYDSLMIAISEMDFYKIPKDIDYAIYNLALLYIFDDSNLKDKKEIKKNITDPNVIYATRGWFGRFLHKQPENYNDAYSKGGRKDGKNKEISKK